MTVDSAIGFVQDAAMVVVDSTVLQCRVEDVLHQAQFEPVEIIRHDRRAFVLMSADVVVRAVERTEIDTGPHP